MDRASDRSFVLASAVEGALGEPRLCRHFREKGGEMEALARRSGLEGDAMAVECGRQLSELQDDFESALLRSAQGAVGDEEGATSVREAVCLKRRGKKKRALCAGSLWNHSAAPVPASRRQRERRREGDTAAAAGAKFLKENVARAGVVELRHGLQYKILRAGSGSVRPGREDVCSVHYRGSLIDCELRPGPKPCEGGTVFDSTMEKGRPASFSAKVAGSFWELALPVMVRGDFWEFYVPQMLGFAGNDNPDRRPQGVGPNATLIFQVELLKIKGKDEDPDADTGTESGAEPRTDL